MGSMSDVGWEGRAFLKRAHHLPAGDRLVLELFYREGLSRTRIAGVMRVQTATVSRKLARLSRRLRDPLVVALVEAPERELATIHRSLGIRHFLCGEKMVHLAKEHRMTAGQVKEVLMYLRGWHRGKMVNSEL